MVSSSLHPDTLEKAMAFLAQGFRPIAGGTDFMLEPKKDADIFFLDKLEVLQRIEESAEGVWVGAGCAFSAIMADDRIPIAFREAVGSIASPAIRNMGTLGGNIKNASPAGDTLPVLYALDAILMLQSPSGTRYLPIDKAVVGDKKTILKPDELIIRVLISQFQGTQRFYKVGARLAQAISKCSLATFLRVQGGVVEDFRVAFGAVGPTVIRSRRLEGMLAGLSVQQARERIPQLINAYSTLITPMDNARSTAKYRRKACMNLLKSFLEDGLEMV